MTIQKEINVYKIISIKNSNFQKIVEIAEKKKIKLNQVINDIFDFYFKDELLTCPNCEAKFSSKIFKQNINKINQP